MALTVLDPKQAQKETTLKGDGAALMDRTGQQVHDILGPELLRAVESKENLITKEDAEQFVAQHGIDRGSMIRFIAEGKDRYQTYVRALDQAKADGAITQEIYNKTLRATLEHRGGNWQSFIAICNSNMAKWQPKWKKLVALRLESVARKRSIEAQLGRPLTTAEIPALAGLRAKQRTDNYAEWEKMNTEVDTQLKRYELERTALVGRARATVQGLASQGLVDAGDAQKWVSWLQAQGLSNRQYGRYIRSALPAFIKRTSGSDAQQWSALQEQTAKHGIPFHDSNTSVEQFLQLPEGQRKSLLLRTKQGVLERPLIMQRHIQALQTLVAANMMPKEDIAKWKQWLKDQRYTNDRLRSYPVTQTVMQSIGSDALQFIKKEEASQHSIDQFLTLSASERKTELARLATISTVGEEAALSPDVQESIEQISNPHLKAVYTQAAQTFTLTEWQSFVERTETTVENNQRLHLSETEQSGAADVVVEEQQELDSQGTDEGATEEVIEEEVATSDQSIDSDLPDITTEEKLHEHREEVKHEGGYGSTKTVNHQGRETEVMQVDVGNSAQIDRSLQRFSSEHSGANDSKSMLSFTGAEVSTADERQAAESLRRVKNTSDLTLAS